MRLSREIDEISSQITRITPKGEIPTEYDSVEAFFESVLWMKHSMVCWTHFRRIRRGVDSKSISVSSVATSRRARQAIDDALGEMQVIHQNGASTEAHLDAALGRLTAFVESH